MIYSIFSGSRVQVGDWVQASEQITEPDFMGAEEWEHARLGDIGHVMGVHSDAPDVYTVTWERTGTTTDCHESQFIRLCSAGTGSQDRKAQIVD